MSKLKGTNYHRAESLGDGAFGAVVVVYSDDGVEYAQKTFEEDEEDEDYTGELDVGVLRELSALRLLMNRHENVLTIEDIVYDEDTELISLIMPKYPMSLSDAIKKSHLPKGPPRVKVVHGLLSALAFLHDNDIVHRDVKTDNVMLDGNDTPILIDFSLAKVLTSEEVLTEATHTGNVGSACYIAPECYRNEPYGIKVDAYSAGVIALEIFNGKRLSVDRDKAAFTELAGVLEKLPEGKPFPTLLRGLLDHDVDSRSTCRSSLSSPLFQKSHVVPSVDRVLEPALKEVAPSVPDVFSKDNKLRVLLPKLSTALEISSDFAVAASKIYKNAAPNVPLQYCLMVASKMYDESPIHYNDCEEAIEGLSLECSIDEYCKAELEILENMNYCLFVDFECLGEGRGNADGRKKKKSRKN
mmetsp:Transcript_18844/g.34926  ORF Transcript_18844/g.34926 Transcript_18844/m.34926 type:complete len:413 (+) Transcript_18844:44-1282(+)